MNRFLLYLALLSSIAPSAMADTYSYGTDGNCHQYSGGGADRGVVQDSICGPDIYQWKMSDGNCHEYSGGGADHGVVPDSLCQ